jgi:hypothetical protein
MDILSDHRITALVARESELSQRAEYARVALERDAERPAGRAASTAALACVPSTSH